MAIAVLALITGNEKFSLSALIAVALGMYGLRILRKRSK